jgi:hypothetical protein
VSVLHKKAPKIKENKQNSCLLSCENGEIRINFDHNIFFMVIVCFVLLFVQFMTGPQIDMELVHMSIRPLLLMLGDYRSLNLPLIQVTSCRVIGYENCVSYRSNKMFSNP